MKKILVIKLTGCTFGIDDKEINIVHAANYNGDDRTLCGNAYCEYIFKDTNKHITCKECLRIINYCKEK